MRNERSNQWNKKGRNKNGNRKGIGRSMFNHIKGTRIETTSWILKEKGMRKSFGLFGVSVITTCIVCNCFWFPSSRFMFSDILMILMIQGSVGHSFSLTNFYFWSTCSFCNMYACVSFFLIFLNCLLCKLILWPLRLHWTCT